MGRLSCYYITSYPPWSNNRVIIKDMIIYSHQVNVLIFQLT